MLHHTFTPSDVTEKSGYLDQSIISQCSVLLKIPERETQNQFSCRGDVTFSRAFTAQVKVKHESSARPKTTRGLFNQTDFCMFRPTLKIKLNKLSPKTWKSPGHATLYTCRVEECRGSLSPQGIVAQEKPASIEPNHVYDQRDPDIVIQETDSEVSYVHTLTYSMEHLKLKCQFQTAKCKTHELNPL